MYSALRQQTSEKHDHAMFKSQRMQEAEADAQPAQIIFQIKNILKIRTHLLAFATDLMPSK